MSPFLALCLGLALAAPAQVVDRVAAVVNGEPVTFSELVTRAGSDYERAEEMKPGEARDQARARALKAAFDQIVAERLFAAQAQTLGVEVTDQQVDAAIEDVKRHNHFDDPMLDQALATQGLDRASYRKQVKRDLEAFQILNYKVKSRVKVTDEDVRNYYQTHQGLYAGDDEVKVRHIFLAVPKNAGAEDEARVKAQADAVLARARAGEDFARLAREVSQAPNASDGGDLGWLKRGTAQPDLERAAFALQAGQISDLVRTRSGFHILEVEARRKGGAKSFDDVKEEIRDRLTNEQLENYRSQYVAELKKDALIEVRIPELQE